MLEQTTQCHHTLGSKVLRVPEHQRACARSAPCAFGCSRTGEHLRMSFGSECLKVKFDKGSLPPLTESMGEAGQCRPPGPWLTEQDYIESQRGKRADLLDRPLPAYVHA